MQPVAVVVVHARDVDVEPALRKVADAVLIVVARQGLRHPEQGVGSIHDAEDRIHDEQRLCALGACQPRRTDDGSAHKAQQHIDCIQRQELPGPGLTALRRLCREGQRLADEFFRLLAGKALFFFDAAALQKLGHRHVQNFCQRHQQGDIRHAQAPLPFAHGLIRYIQVCSQLPLGHALFPAQLRQKAAECGFVQFVHVVLLVSLRLCSWLHCTGQTRFAQPTGSRINVLRTFLFPVSGKR